MSSWGIKDRATLVSTEGFPGDSMRSTIPRAKQLKLMASGRKNIIKGKNGKSDTISVNMRALAGRKFQTHLHSIY